MNTPQLTDWRVDVDVLQARAAHEAAQTAVGELEGELRRASVALQRGEAALREAEIAGDLGAVAQQRRQVIAARTTIGKLEARAEGVYEAAQLATEALRAAETAARQAAWPGQLAEYRRLTSELAWAIDAALEAEEALERSHRELCGMFPGGGGWALAPDGRLIGNAAFRDRRLRRGPVDVWRQWVGEHVLDDPATGARKLAQELRALVGA